jgi:cytochrome c2
MAKRAARFLLLVTCVTLAALAAGARFGQPATVAAQDSPEEHFKYGSIGIEENEGMPYWIWQVLPRVCPDKLPGGYASIGFTWEPGKELPVGFSKKDFFGGTRVAINCAFCHTSVYQRSPGDSQHLVPGGPGNRIDPQSYVRFLQSCAADDRFNPSNVLAKIGEITSLSWRESLTYRFLTIPAVKTALKVQQGEYAWMNSRTNWGKGRIDPFNPVKFRILKVPMDDTIGNSDMVAIVNMRARQGMSLHWDGLSSSLREVVLSSAIGDGASRKTVDLASLQRIEDWLMAAPPARWPYAVDATLAAEGKPVYDAACASCHSVGGARTGHVIPVDEIGTDRHRFDMWTAEASGAYNAFADGYPWDFKGFRKTNGYVAVPLDGVWLRAPYLHNGSVPYLAELFEPVEKRTKSFRRGYALYDQARIGFVSEGPDAQKAGTPYDTSQPGNGNGGHLYGIDLAPDKKKALLEYLKTL